MRHSCRIRPRFDICLHYFRKIALTTSQARFLRHLAANGTIRETDLDTYASTRFSSALRQNAFKDAIHFMYAPPTPSCQITFQSLTNPPPQGSTTSTTSAGNSPPSSSPPLPSTPQTSPTAPSNSQTTCPTNRSTPISTSTPPWASTSAA
jgi:hypothetical protein